jgi:hypothetical protein
MEEVNSTTIYCKSFGKCHDVLQYNNNKNKWIQKLNLAVQWDSAIRWPKSYWATGSELGIVSSLGVPV